MSDELMNIKNKIIDTTVMFALIFILPSIAFLITYLIKGIWENILLAHMLYCFVLFILFFGRKKIQFNIKLILLSIALIIIGMSSLIVYNFSGVFYICFIPILLNGMLLGRNHALVYLIGTGLVYFSIALGYSRNWIGQGFDYNEQVSSFAAWVVFFIGTIFVLVIILTATSQFHGYFIKSIHERDNSNKMLLDYQNKLESLVQERTEELETTNEELLATNDELYVKNDQIEEKNNELSKALQQLKDTQIHLMQSEKMASLGVLTAGVAHEINNPLNFIEGSIMGLEDYVETHLKENIEDIAPFMNGLKVGVERTTTIVKSLNQFSRTNGLKREKCDIHKIISNCLVMLNNHIKGRVKVVKDYTNKTISLTADIGKLHQVMLNVLSNAVQAIEGKGILKIVTSIDAGNLLVQVIDNGKGIPEEIMSKVTDPFFTTKSPGKGTGLGLYITYNILKEHEGHIRFASSESKGTTTVITLPLKLEN